MGEEVLARALSRFGEGVQDFRPVWEAIHLNFVQIEEQQFDSQGARGGQPWPPLSPSYAAWKEKWSPGMPILRLTQRMWGEFAVGVGMMVDIAPMYMRLTPTVDYAQWHQRGTSRMPARKVVQLTEPDKMGWMKMLHSYVYDKAREARLL
jgi:hypothetical protein